MGKREAPSRTIKWRISLTKTAARMLAKIRDKRTRRALAKAIDRLEEEPEAQGKPLQGELEGLYSARAAGQRHRIIHKLKKNRVVVLIVAVDLRRAKDRRDIYELARKIIRSGLA